MKAILVGFFLLFSFNANSAPIELMTGQFSNPFLGGYGGCSLTGCGAGIFDPWVIADVNDTGEPQPDTDEAFWSGIDLVIRDMTMNFTAYAYEAVSGIVSWESSNLYGPGEIYVFGLTIDLNKNPSGSARISVNAFSSITSHISINANSLDTEAYWSFIFDKDETPPVTVETPLPASLFLFAPALLGFMGLRRKLS
ncbi:hypothetical protein E8Q33_02775 [Methylophaga sp. SB9B]|uniref:hypothetical protein n=1 Tax=Methylophaga sp. SB9B TaxID=2570356 RepID=UPI0010A75102|nr:hypothetical protein [Methylophaga sp. SB9B]THK42487.1 hypothetical protein E8Q33_02775 [Methylophaga sp. SB9B]